MVGSADVVKLPVEVVKTTCAPGVAVPETSFVAAGCVVLLAGDTIATVGTLTIVNVMGCEVLPPGQVAVTVNVLGPTGRTLIGPQANVPDAEAVVVQTV